MGIKESAELASVEDSTLSEDQIRRIFRYARTMLNIFRLPRQARRARQDLEQELEDTNYEFDKEGFMVMAAALLFLSRSSNGSQFFLTEDYDLTPSHEQGFKTVIDSDAAFRKEIEYVSGLAVDVCFLGQFRNLILVNFDRQVALNKKEESLIKTRLKEELIWEQVVIFTEPI